MNLQHFARHFAAIVWLRWRLGMNQLQRGGVLNTVLLALAAVASVLFAFGLFAGAFFIGWFAAGWPNWVVLIVWDAVALGFLFVWMLGLLNEMQRAETLSLDKFLHLPVSPTGAFLINYLSSLVNVTLILFLAAALGLAIGQVAARGAWGLLNFPLIGAFVLAVTAVTYQFQGWLASLMANPRRRRAIVVAVSTLVILASQAPNLILQGGKWTRNDPNAEHPRVDRGEQMRWMEQSAWIVNLVLPPGWLPLGAAGAFEGNPWPALLGTLGLGLVGAGSLHRAYRTTVRLYRGEFSAGTARPTPEAVPSPPPPVSGPSRFLERRIPGLSERTTAVALASLVGLWRAPEVKLMLISPLIMGLIFGWMLLSSSTEPPPVVRPLIGMGGMGLILLSMVQLTGNAFGFDRSGFRVYILCPAPRREVLLGKNLALVPMPIFWGAILLAVLQWSYPLRIDHLAGTVPMLVSMFVLFCMLANWLSIFAPMPVAAGSFRRASPKMTVFLLHLAFFFTFPIALTLVMLPLGAEVVLETLGLAEGMPVFLIGSVLVCAGTVALYWLMLGWQGTVLQRREQTILGVLTSRESASS